MATVPELYNLARMSTATTGTGTITLGSAVSSYLTFAQAGVSDGETVSYGIVDGSNHEVGRGVYTSSGTTLTRSVLKSTNSDAAISLSGSAQVYIAALREDFLGGWVRLSTASASNNATIDIAIPSGYEEYEIALYNVVPATDGADLRFRTSTDGGSTFDSGANDYGTGLSYVALTNGTGVGSDVNENGISGHVFIYRPGTAQYCHVYAQFVFIGTDGQPNDRAPSGARLAVADVDYVRIYYSTGNVESGEFRLFGRRS